MLWRPIEEEQSLDSRQKRAGMTSKILLAVHHACDNNAWLDIFPNAAHRISASTPTNCSRACAARKRVRNAAG